MIWALKDEDASFILECFKSRKQKESILDTIANKCPKMEHKELLKGRLNFNWFIMWVRHPAPSAKVYDFYLNFSSKFSKKELPQLQVIYNVVKTWTHWCKKIWVMSCCTDHRTKMCQATSGTIRTIHVWLFTINSALLNAGVEGIKDTAKNILHRVNWSWL